MSQQNQTNQDLRKMLKSMPAGTPLVAKTNGAYANVSVGTTPTQKAKIFAKAVGNVNDIEEIEMPMTVRQFVELIIQQVTDDKDIGLPEAIRVIDTEPDKVSVSNDTVELAEKVIKYYQSKMFNRKMSSDIELSEYQQVLSHFVADPERSMKESYKGVGATIYRFYKNDQEKEALIVNYKSVPENTHTQTDKEYEMKFVKSYYTVNSKAQRKVYVFERNDYLLTYSVDQREVAQISLLDYVLKSSKTITAKLEAASVRFMDEFRSMNVRTFEIV